MQELCYYGIFALFYFIAGVVSAVNAYRDGAVVAAAVSIFTLAVEQHTNESVLEKLRVSSDFVASVESRKLSHVMRINNCLEKKRKTKDSWIENVTS